MSFLSINAGDLLVGILFPAAVIWAQARTSRRMAAMELLRDFHAPDISAARRTAFRFICEHLPDEVPALEASSGLSDAERDERASFYTVQRFFVRLNALRKGGLIESRLVREQFGPSFAFWWHFAFCHHLARPDWGLKEEIESLYLWLADEAARKEAWARDWAKWSQVGIDTREQKLGECAAAAGAQP